MAFEHFAVVTRFPVSFELYGRYNSKVDMFMMSLDAWLVRRHGLPKSKEGGQLSRSDRSWGLEMYALKGDGVFKQ